MAIPTMVFLYILVSAPIISVQATGAYDSGSSHGCSDAGKGSSDKYINQDEKGPSYHTSEFMDGYNAGYSNCNNGDGDSDKSDSRDSDKSDSRDSDKSDSRDSDKSDSRDCNGAGLAGGIVGGLVGSLIGPEGTIGGFSAGSSYAKDACQNP